MHLSHASFGDAKGIDCGDVILLEGVEVSSLVWAVELSFVSSLNFFSSPYLSAQERFTVNHMIQHVKVNKRLSRYVCCDLLFVPFRYDLVRYDIFLGWFSIMFVKEIFLPCFEFRAECQLQWYIHNSPST